MEFSINEIIFLLWRRFVLISICTLSGFLIFFTFTRYGINPTYTASVQMYVSSDDTTSSIDLNDLYYAQKVVTTYINFLKTKVFYNQVIEESKLNYTSGELKDMTEINSVNNTEIFQISVTSDSAEDSYKLVTAMQKLAPEHIKSIKLSADISVVDPVDYPSGPSGPNILLNTAIGGLLGFFLSVSITFLWEIIGVNVKNEDELKRKYNKPILGAIPNYEEHKTKRNLIQMIDILMHRNNARNDIVISEETDFIIAESYKEFRTNLRYTLSKEGCKKILVNSPISQDGKSTICTNLGITIAQTGAKVLLMDCDLRKGRLHNFFNLRSNPGISELLSGLAKEKDVIQHTNYENLQIITMGKVPPNPTELLSGGQMEEVLKSLEKNYDFILMDSPPVNVVSDVLSLTKLVDGVLLVVRENVTSHPNIAGAISKLEFVEAKIIGFAFNGVSMKRGNKSKSKYYYNYYNEKND
jgi:capsular exopolysaccharide synthesis family protein